MLSRMPTRAPRAGPSRHDRSPVERGHDADARALHACHKVGISNIEAMHLVQLNSALEKRTINDADGTRNARLVWNSGPLELS